MKMIEVYYNYIGSLQIPEWLPDQIPMSGSCDNAIDEALQEQEVNDIFKDVTDENLVKELYEYGCWENEELKNRETNIKRMLWLIVGDIQDGRFNEE